MGEYVNAHITLGGPVTKKFLDRLYALASHEYLGADWGTAFENRTAFDKYVAETISIRQPLFLCDAEASYGRLDSFEALCQQYHVPYRRWGDSCAGCGPEEVYYDGKEAEQYEVNEAGHLYVTLEELIKHYAEGTISELIARNGRLLTPIPPLCTPVYFLYDDN
jgi:hypothetical protein